MVSHIFMIKMIYYFVKIHRLLVLFDFLAVIIAEESFVWSPMRRKKSFLHISTGSSVLALIAWPMHPLDDSPSGAGTGLFFVWLDSAPCGTSVGLGAILFAPPIYSFVCFSFFIFLFIIFAFIFRIRTLSPFIIFSFTLLYW